MLCNSQQKVFILRGGHPGHGAHLGIADLTCGEGGVYQWQDFQALGHANFLPGRAQGDAALPVQPMGTGAHGTAAAPGLALVKLGDEFQQAMIARIDLAGQQGDFLAEHFIFIRVSKPGWESGIGHGGEPSYTVHMYSIFYLRNFARASGLPCFYRLFRALFNRPFGQLLV